MNKFFSLFSIVIAGFFSSITAHADVNVAQGKPVILIGAFGTGSGYFPGGHPPLPPASIVTDGSFQSGYWTNGVWWDEHNSGTHNYVVIDLQGAYAINSFSAMVDNNDPYLLEYKDTYGNWQTAWNIPEVPGFGLSLRTVNLPNTITATELRLSSFFVNTPGHDYAYSVSEIQTVAVSSLPPDPGPTPTPTPEAGTWMMMLFGSGFVSWQVRRKQASK